MTVQRAPLYRSGSEEIDMNIGDSGKKGSSSRVRGDPSSSSESSYSLGEPLNVLIVKREASSEGASETDTPLMREKRQLGESIDEEEDEEGTMVVVVVATVRNWWF